MNDKSKIHRRSFVLSSVALGGGVAFGGAEALSATNGSSEKQGTASTTSGDFKDSVTLTAADVASVIGKLEKLADELPMEEQATLRLLLARMDHKLPQEMPAGEFVVPDIKAATQDLVAGTKSGVITVSSKTKQRSAWVRGGPMWARWSSRRY